MESEMIRLPRFGLLPLLALAAFLCTAGCHKNPAQIAADATQAGTQDQSTDPAAANLVPVEAATAAEPCPTTAPTACTPAASTPQPAAAAPSPAAKPQSAPSSASLGTSEQA